MTSKFKVRLVFRSVNEPSLFVSFMVNVDNAELRRLSSLHSTYVQAGYNFFLSPRQRARLLSFYNSLYSSDYMDMRIDWIKILN